MPTVIYNIYLSDINKASSIHRLFICADDTTLCGTFCDFRSRYIKIINSHETTSMLFHRLQKSIQIPAWDIDKTVLECVKYFAFIDIHFDKHLSWNEHSNTISNKITETIGILKKSLQHTLHSS